MTTTKYKVGDSVVCNGYPNKVIAVTSYGMIEVRSEHGDGCVDPNDELTVQPGIVWEHMCAAAKSDMRKARKEGSILIAQTRRGTVELAYVDGGYEIRADGRDLGRASTAKLAVEMIAPLYQITIEG